MASTLQHIQQIQRNTNRQNLNQLVRRDVGLIRSPRSTRDDQLSSQIPVVQSVSANRGISAREFEQLDQIVGLSFTNPEIGNWLVRFPHLVLNMVGLPMPRSFAALMCAPDLVNLKDLALRSAALFDECGLSDQMSQRDPFEHSSMSENWAF